MCGVGAHDCNVCCLGESNKDMQFICTRTSLLELASFVSPIGTVGEPSLYHHTGTPNALECAKFQT